MRKQDSFQTVDGRRCAERTTVDTEGGVERKAIGARGAEWVRETQQGAADKTLRKTQKFDIIPEVAKDSGDP